MKVLIIEDENLAIEKLIQTLKKVKPEAEVIGITQSIAGSVKWLENRAVDPDLILMDIELADGQSFSIFDEIKLTCPVIFVTSYDEYALKAFKVNSIDYLLKPIQKAELNAALTKLEHLKNSFGNAKTQSIKIEKLVHELQNQARIANYRKRFLVKHAHQLVSIEVETIAYFYFDERVTFFRSFDNRKYIVEYTMDELEALVDPSIFFRINRSLLASIRSIGQIQQYFGNRLTIRLKPDFEKEAIVSREKVNDFKTWMGK